MIVFIFPFLGAILAFREQGALGSTTLGKTRETEVKHVNHSKVHSHKKYKLIFNLRESLIFS
jgi:hypothetical protein